MDVKLDYSYRPWPRDWGRTRGGAQMRAMLDAGAGEYKKLLFSFIHFQSDFEKIVLRNALEASEPCWINSWIPGLDTASIYGLLALQNPSIYFEIGSGHSTKFARRAIKDHALKTKIISIDPQPRTSIDALCDEIIRQPCENVDMERFEKLPADTILFVDNSHRSFMNSDVTVFFTEILPVLPRGIIWGLHDVFLPEDYPVQWTERYYNEQYLLMAYLLGGGGRDSILLPNFYISHHPELGPLSRKIFQAPLFDGVETHGACFWMKRS